MRWVMCLSGLLPLGTEDLNDRLESKPLRDVFAGTQHLSELGARELLHIESLLLGLVGGDVLEVGLIASAHEVQAGHRLHTELLSVGLCEVLCLEGAVEVLAVDRRLGTSHVAADDEVRAAEVFADEHVLDRLARASHMHRVRQVGPLRALAGGGVLGLLDEDLVRLVADGAGDVILLGRAAGRVHEHDGVVADVRGIERTREELVVRTVDGVAALEGDDVRVVRKRLTHLRRRGARELARRHAEALHCAANVILATLHRHHAHARMLNGASAVALDTLKRLVGRPLRLDGHDSHVGAVEFEQELLANLDAVVVGVHDDGQTEDVAIGQLEALNNAVVRVLVEEAGERREAAVAQQLDVARLALGDVDRLVSRRRKRCALTLRREEVDEGAAVRHLLRRHLNLLQRGGRAHRR
mmetsp:Transcript_87061/g.173898  ORF Transcript_87061/g.173898 Transcript_87061/m.173898 type:complete len:413 (-) Transcript_87061:117-1355(-)